jgi:hypothetical protein
MINVKRPLALKEEARFTIAMSRESAVPEPVADAAGF